MNAIGILGLGAYLPPTIRTNDYWSPSIVDAWSDRMTARVTRGEALPSDVSEGARRTIEAMTIYGKDPFRGARQRHILGDMSIHEAEARAAKEAIERSGIRPSEIDVILSETLLPEQQLVNNACILHKALELPQRCTSIATGAACNAFAMHATLAQALIASGQARNVLSVHGCGISRILNATEPESAWWGDGASAVVFGPVSQNRGILAALHQTDGSLSNALVIGVPGGHWWDGKNTLHAPDRTHTRGMLMGIADRARETIHATLASAGVAPSDVGFYASHQGMAWLTEVTQAHAGLGGAKTVTTFPAFGNLGSANIPLILSIAQKEGLLRDGMVVATFSGGVGETWSGLCLRWGA